MNGIKQLIAILALVLFVGGIPLAYLALAEDECTKCGGYGTYQPGQLTVIYECDLCEGP